MEKKKIFIKIEWIGKKDLTVRNTQFGDFFYARLIFSISRFTWTFFRIEFSLLKNGNRSFKMNRLSCGWLLCSQIFQNDICTKYNNNNTSSSLWPLWSDFDVMLTNGLQKRHFKSKLKHSEYRAIIDRSKWNFHLFPLFKTTTKLKYYYYYYCVRSKAHRIRNVPPNHRITEHQLFFIRCWEKLERTECDIVLHMCRKPNQIDVPAQYLWINGMNV